MTVMDTIRARHSVRDYLNRPVEGEDFAALEGAVADAGVAGGLNVQLVRDNPEVFKLFLARYGVIKGARTSIVFVARDGEQDEAIGYWGERIVLIAQELGLNTCWQAMSARKKSKAEVPEGEDVRIVIAVGYGKTRGKPRKTKPLEVLCTFEGTGPMPAWFETAMEAAQLAPTGMNSQKFHITLRADGRTVTAEAPEGGLNAINLGIVKRPFELAADETGADWAWE